MWAIIKSQLARKRIYNLRQLVTVIRKTWRAPPAIFVTNLVESMPRRCQAILDAGGNFTVYLKSAQLRVTCTL